MNYVISLRGYKICSLKDFPTMTTNRDQLQLMINSLHPISTDKSLIRLGPQSDGGIPGSRRFEWN